MESFFLGFYFLFYFPFKNKNKNKWRLQLFFKNQFLTNKKASLADRMGAHMKNAGPQIGDSAGDFEDQTWTLVEENVAFNWSISGCLFF